MKELFISEWQRLWQRKSTWISFALAAVVIIFSLQSCIKTDSKIIPDNIKYVSSLSFPNTFVSSEKVMVFDVIAIMLIIMAVTSEYREGQLRMVMIRNFSFGQIFKAKYLVILSTVFLLLFFTFITSTLLGNLFLPCKQVKALGALKAAGILYSAKYYLVAFVILIAFISVIMCISLICKTTIGAVAASMVFILMSMDLPDLCQALTSSTSHIYTFMNYTFITRIQYSGVSTILSGISHETILMLASVAFHIAVFYFISLNMFSSHDCYI